MTVLRKHYRPDPHEAMSAEYGALSFLLLSKLMLERFIARSENAVEALKGMQR